MEKLTMMASEALAAGPTDPSSVPPLPGMIWIPGTTFLMGSDRHYPEEAPAHQVKVDGFWIDAKPVTNSEFRVFAKETAYRTIAERVPDALRYPGAKPELLVPGSVVFRKPAQPVDLRNHFHWWTWLPERIGDIPRDPEPG